MPNFSRCSLALVFALSALQGQTDESAEATHQREVRYTSRGPALVTGSDAGLKPRATLQSMTTVATLPYWTATSGSYTYQMVGASPMVAQSASTTTIPVPLIPIILQFADGSTFDPTKPDGCSAQSPVSLTLSSPVFSTSGYAPGGTSVGTTQFADFYQRANYWKFTGPTGINPNYHFLLSPATAAPITIKVPAASGGTSAAPCGRLGQMDINWFDPYIHGTVFPQLATAGVLPSQFPIFLLYNVAMYDSATGCCYVGYHSAFNHPSFSGTIQTYATAAFLTSGGFGTTADVEPLSHEVIEWMSDPVLGNPAPGWRRSPTAACETRLEPADPLSGISQIVTMSNSYAYHVQEIAFVSWFYRDIPSMAVNGWYSSNKTFTAPSSPCYTPTTTLSINPATVAAGSTSSVSLQVAPAAGGSVGTPTGSVTLATSQSVTVGTYPLSNGSYSGTIAFPAGSYSVTAKYLGDANYASSSSSPVTMNVGAPVVSLSPVSLTFPSTSLGSATSAQTVTLKNNGTAPLTSIAVSLAGAAPGDFSLTSTCPSSLSVGAACNISVIFKPTAIGTRTASLSVADNATGSPQTVPVTGSGANSAQSAGVAKYSLSAAALTFPATGVGSSSASKTVALTNTGTASLTGISVAIAGANPADFPTTSNCPSTLAIGASCSISTVFRPSAAGSRAATINVLTALNKNPQTIGLTGTGVIPPPTLSLSATALAFPSTVVKSSSAAQTVTLRNSGTAAATFTSISITGKNLTDFVQANTCGAGLNIGASCTVSITFKPSATGVRSGALTISGNVTGSVALTGSGK